MPLNSFPNDWNYYEVLGLAYDASAQRLKKAFRRAAKQYHPDVNKGSGAEERFKQINEAYSCLSDPVTRRKYDEFLKNKSSNGSGATTGSTRSKVKMSPNPSSVGLGTLTWDEHRKVVVDVVSFKDDSLAGYVIDAQWIGAKPAWASEIDLPDDAARKMVQAVFVVNASLVDEGTYKAVIEIGLYAEVGDKLVDSVQIPVTFKVGRIQTLEFDLKGQPSKLIRLGPYEVGQKDKFQGILENNGPPVWESPTLEWVGGTPAWASDVRASSGQGQIFPLSIGFSIDTEKCDPRKGPLRAMIAIKLKGKVVGEIPVVMEVLKVPQPDVFPVVNQINLGVMEWNDIRAFDLKLENRGDSPKHPVRVTVHDANNGWLQVASSIEPTDKDSFPKRVVLKANATAVAAGDYIATVRVQDDNHARDVQVMVRVGPRPSLVADTSAIGFSWSRDEFLSFMVNVDSVGGPAPYVSVSWERQGVDYVAYDAPVIHGRSFPIQVRFTLRLDGYDADWYRNTLLVKVSQNADAHPVCVLRIPVEGSRKK